MTRKVNLILGPPGTGKTTTLLDTVAQHIDEGILPQRIAFVSFTKKAADEAATRAMEKFNLDRQQLPYFRTLHSLAYRELNVNRRDVLGKGDYKEIATLLGTEFKGYSDISDGVITQNSGDSMLHLIGIAKATGQSLKQVWQYHDEPVAWYGLKLFSDTIDKYKQDMDKLDFSDMLDLYTEQRLFADVDVAIIDEAQDLSNAQWDMCKVAFRKAGHVYIAGDDDQAIYEWSGANVDRLLGITANKTVLNKTYRLPLSIYNTAIKISGRIGKRFAKEWKPADTRVGNVQHITSPEQVPIKPGESWMLLARNNYLLAAYVDHCETVGIPYITARGPAVDIDHYELISKYLMQQRNGEVDEDIPWHDALTKIPLAKREYYLACLRNGFKLNKAVYIGTIHSVKGGEADNVAIITDISWRSHLGMDKRPDAEHRVFYVGATRAKENLYIIDPQTDKCYAI